MRIFGLCLVKNEADIMRLSLEESLRWCDRIFVFDNGSSDATWDITREVAARDRRVVPFKQDPKPFDDALRAEIFNEYRLEARAGDWWCRLDADEFYVDDPRTFLGSVSPANHVVWGAWLQFFLTERDLDRFPAGSESEPPFVTPDFLPRYYQAKGGEPRFFRHRDRLVWPAGSWPAHLGLVEPRRIRVKHFQYRSPAQIQCRLDTRRAAAAHGWEHFGHSIQENWREKIANANSLTLDQGNGQYASESSAPYHLERSWQRAIKRLMHGLGVWP
jgi:Glycosyl transferase family 2